MGDLIRLGCTQKKGWKEQAGKFGEGFKIGALGASRLKFAIVVEAAAKRRVFSIKKKQLWVSHQDAAPSKKAKKDTGLIHIDFVLRKPHFYPCRYRFDPRFFRVLSPGTPFNKDGGVLLDDVYQGTIYCMGIEVSKRPESSVFGYDVPSRDFVAHGRKGGIDYAVLEREVGRILELSLEREAAKHATENDLVVPETVHNGPEQDQHTGENVSQLLTTLLDRLLEIPEDDLH